MRGEKTYPAQQVSMKKNSCLQEITHPTPPQSKVKWSASNANLHKGHDTTTPDIIKFINMKMSQTLCTVLVVYC